MDNIKLSQANMTYIARKNTEAPKPQVQPIAPQVQPVSVKEKKSGKKSLLIGLGAVATLAVAAILISRGKFGNKAKDVVKEATEQKRIFKGVKKNANFAPIKIKKSAKNLANKNNEAIQEVVETVTNKANDTIQEAVETAINKSGDTIQEAVETVANKGNDVVEDVIEATVEQKSKATKFFRKGEIIRNADGSPKRFKAAKKDISFTSAKLNDSAKDLANITDETEAVFAVANKNNEIIPEAVVDITTSAKKTTSGWPPVGQDKISLSDGNTIEKIYLPDREVELRKDEKGRLLKSTIKMSDGKTIVKGYDRLTPGHCETVEECDKNGNILKKVAMRYNPANDSIESITIEKTLYNEPSERISRKFEYEERDPNNIYQKTKFLGFTKYDGYISEEKPLEFTDPKGNKTILKVEVEAEKPTRLKWPPMGKDKKELPNGKTTEKIYFPDREVELVKLKDGTLTRSYITMPDGTMIEKRYPINFPGRCDASIEYDKNETALRRVDFNYYRGVLDSMTIQSMPDADEPPIPTTRIFKYVKDDWAVGEKPEFIGYKDILGEDEESGKLLRFVAVKGKGNVTKCQDK